jgi:hypothetical protein
MDALKIVLMSGFQDAHHVANTGTRMCLHIWYMQGLFL